MHIFLKEQKHLKDHAAKIHLIFKSPNENKQNQAFPNQKIHFLDTFPNQKLSFLLHFQTKIPFYRCISKPKTHTWAITNMAKKVGVLQNTIIHPPLTLNLSYNNLFSIVNIYTRNIWLSK